MPETNHKLLLSEWSVLSLRPQGQHAVAHCASELRGANFFACSSMKLEAVENDEELKKVLSCHHIIVTSPAAARFAGQSPVFFIPQNSHWFALGDGSASVLKKVGVENITRPEHGSNSESLLALPTLQNVQGKNIGLITAPGGRGLIETILLERGANVFVANMYQRKSLAISADEIKNLRELHSPFAVLCSSYEIFQSLWQQIDAELKQSLGRGLWIVSSLRLQDLLQQAGILHISVSTSAQPEAMLAHLQHVQTQALR
ncbi:MAG: uroporphyrinogen-III synthase [Arenimonas sp.]